MRKYSLKYLESDAVKKKIEVVEKWVEQFGIIWSRRVLYELVSNQLVKDTSGSYISLDVIESTCKSCRKEVKEWMDKHYVK